MARNYHTLLLKDGSWGVAFAHYELVLVKEELQHYRDDGWNSSELRIITTDGTLAAIDAELAKLNGKQP